MSNNNYLVDGKIKLPYNFEKEKYIIGVEKKSDNTLVGTKTIVPIKDTPPNNKIEITPVFSPTFHFAYENNVFNIIKNELYFNINLIIDEIPVSLKELNDENGLVVDWDEKYLIEKTNNPAEFKLSLKNGYTSITDTNSVLYNELINNRVFSESINVYIKHDDLYLNTKLDILFSKSYFEVTSLYDTIDINSGVSENFITIDGYYNDTKVNKDDLSLTFKKNGENIFTNVISTLGFVSLTKVKNEWALHCEDSDKISSENKYQVSTGGTIVFNKQKVQYVYNENGEYFDLNSGKRVFLKGVSSDESTVVYDNKNVIPGINIVDPFNNIKINKNVSFDSINFIVKDTHDRVKLPNNGEYYPIDRVHATIVLNANNNYLYDKNGRLINKDLNDTLIIEGGLILSGLSRNTKVLSGNTEVITNNEIVKGFENVISKTGNTFYYKNKRLYASGKGYFNGEQVSNLCPLVTDELGNILYSVKLSNGNIYITDSSGNSLYIAFEKTKLQWRIYGSSDVFSVKNGELLYNGIVIGDRSGNLYRRHDLNLIDFKHTNLVIDEAKITDIYDGKDVESEIVNRDEVYYDAHSISEIKKSIPNLYAYLLSYNANNENTELPKINIEATYDGVMVDEKVFSISNGTLNHSSYGIKIEPQVITQSMIQNGGTVTAYIVNKSGEQIPHSTYSKNNYSFSYVFDSNNSPNIITNDTCTINLSTGNPVYNEIKFTLKCGNRTVKEEIVEVLGENRLITSVKYIDVTNGATYTITPSKDLYGNNIDWTTGTGTITALTINPGDTTQKILSGTVNGVKVYEQTVIPVKNGNDGESPYTLVLTNTNASINCDSEGKILNGIKMPTCKAILYKGTTEVTNVSYSINSVTGVRIENNGNLNFTTGFTFTGDSLEIVVSATTNSVLRGTAIMTITKTKQGPKGDTGKGISSVTEYYQISSANTVNGLTNNWSTGITKTDSIKKYLWNYEKTTYTDNTTGATAPVIIGTHGDTGEKGRGISSVTEYYLASDKQTGITITGYTWSTAVTTTNTTKKYLWNYEKTTYTDNTTGATAPVIIGTHGTSGKGISSITEYYLATSASTGVEIGTSGWSTGITTTNATKKYLWNYEKTTYTDGSTGVTNPVIIGTHGTSGKGISSVTEYYLASDKQTGITITGYTWSTAVTTTNTTKKYLWNYEKTTYTDNTTGATAPVIIGTHGEKGDTGASGNSAVSYWMEITPNVIKKIENNFSNSLINISKWKKEGTNSPISVPGGTVFLYIETGSTPYTAITGPTYTIPRAVATANTLTFKWAAGSNSTDAVYDVQTIPILKDGENGEKGDRGKLLYPAGRWDSGTTYIGTDNEKTPFVTHKVGNVDKYYVLTASKNTTSKDIPGASTAWTEMAQYEALYTKLLVAENGLVGGSVYNGDYVFSKYGISSGSSTNNYSGFTNSIVESIFSGNIPNNKFIPNYLVDFNKGRAWFGNGETLINEKGVVHTKNLVEEIKTFILPFRGVVSNAENTGLTNPSYKEIEWDFRTVINSGETIYGKVVKDLNVLVIGHEDIGACVKGTRTNLKLWIQDDSIIKRNEWYKGSIYLSPWCEDFITIDLSSYTNEKGDAIDEKNGTITLYPGEKFEYLFKWDGGTSSGGYRADPLIHSENKRKGYNYKTGRIIPYSNEVIHEELIANYDEIYKVAEDLILNTYLNNLIEKINYELKAIRGALEVMTSKKIPDVYITSGIKLDDLIEGEQ